MNAASISRSDSVPGDNAGDSDSDNSSDGILDYYQPISSSDGDGDFNEPNSNGYHAGDPPSSLPNRHDSQTISENGMRSLNLNEDQDRESEEEDEEVEEEERRRAEWDSAIRRAMEEDENRRNAPLTAENGRRVMEAMRGVSFAGIPPDWAAHVPQDVWIDQLRRLRHPPPSAASFRL